MIQKPTLTSMSAVCLLLAGWCFWPASSSLPKTPTAAAKTETRLLTRPIQEMRPGMRVLAENPELMEADVEPLLIERAQWRLVSLQLAKEDGVALDIELLRPLDWLEENGARIGGTVTLDLEELGAAGPATVTAIDPCPAIEKGAGRIVTGRFAHTAANVIDVHVEGQDEPIGTTDNHPFWSEDRQAFVPAGELKVGERLRTVTGSQTRVKSLSPRGPPETVYNLEVEGEHVYYVSQTGVLVHNNYLADNMRRAGRFGDPGTDAHHIVSKAHKRAKPAREALARHGIDLNSHMNGVWLPRNSSVSRARGVLHNQRGSALTNRTYLDEINQ